MKTVGKALYTYSQEQVIEFRDDDHTPYNKRSGEVESQAAIQVRAPLNADWVNFHVEEATKARGAKHGSTRVISVSMSREQFYIIVAHVGRSKDV